MRSSSSFAVTIAAALGSALAAIPGDLVTSLPGWTGPIPTKQYSGYLNVTSAGTVKHLHYWFVASEGSASDPLVFWFNGGPGCSSLGGFFQEGGPFMFTSDMPPATMVQNPGRWNQVANMVFTESPSCVGFSYSDDPVAGCAFDDTSSATDNYAYVQQFFKYYPEFATNDVYITGESYAGIYIPQLAYQVYQHNSGQVPPAPGDIRVNLRGIAVGNGCTMGAGCYANRTYVMAKAISGHVLISEDTWEGIVTACDNFVQPEPPACMQAVEAAVQNVGPIDVYDIYNPCISNEGSVQRWHAPPSPVHLAVGPSGCFDDNDTLTTYLNTPGVPEAMHVRPTTWRVCGPAPTFRYNHTAPDETATLYPLLISQYRVLVYNGDADLCDNEAWTSRVGKQLGVVEPWRPWLWKNQVAGYVTSYASNFRFATVKGAGHMVPEFQREFGYGLFVNFLTNSTR